MQLEFPCAAPPLAVTGFYKTCPEDFQVRELLPFEPGGGGEHVYLGLRKLGQSTLTLQESLARLAGVPRHHVGYAGLKDSQAVTWQWFSIHLPGRAEPDWSSLEGEGVAIESVCRHSRKLRVGAHTGNRFTLVLRELDGDVGGLPERLQWLRARGFPNYFGEQRFGRGGSNLRLFNDPGPLRRGRLSNKQKMALSSARALLFNQVLACRVEAKSWDRAIAGDLINLNGSQSFFGPIEPGAELSSRLASLEVHPTGPLAGGGELATAAETLALEKRVLSAYPEVLAFIDKFQARSSRRALRAPVGNLQWKMLDDRSLQLDFSLSRGSYATTVLRELGNFRQA